MSSQHSNIAPKKIASIQFGLLSPQEMAQLSEITISNRELFSMPSRRPAPLGVLDSRLGVSDKMSVCETCKLKLTECGGHYGYIKLGLPVFHIGYFKHTISVLQCICKTCSRVLLKDDPNSNKMEYTKYLNIFRGKSVNKVTGQIDEDNTDILKKQATLKKVIESCKKVHLCPHCGSCNGVVKKVTGLSTLKIVHDPYTGSKAFEGNKEMVKDSMRMQGEVNKELNALINDENKFKQFVNEDLLPTRVLELFKKIPDRDCELLWLSPLIGRPENLLLSNLLVPPVPIRPSVAMDVGGGSNEDDLTIKLQEIIDVNIALKLALEKGAPHKTILEEWDFLQLQIAQYINGEMPGLQRPIGQSKQIRGICQRLKGKSGRFRGNLSGKRVDFSARTVISPDPNLKVNQVGVPQHVAKTMTFPERVTRYNIEKLRSRIINGPYVHPGANYVQKKAKPHGQNVKISLQFGNGEKTAMQLEPGDIVDRHMEDGDIVLFNRQPSLHKLSIMAHEVKVMPWRTFRFNICVCAPYNADFDGDEMNMHLPQTEEARTEASLLMGVEKNLITPRNGEPLVAASQDFLTASYLITQRDQFFDKETFCQLVSYLGDASEHIELPPPSIIKPVKLWTGKQIFNIMVKPNRDGVDVNFECKEKNYNSKLSMKHFCPNDGYVCFRQSELISGNIAKKTIGDGSKTGLLYTLLQDHSSGEAARVMNRLAKLCSRYFGGHRGFSIGIDDVTPGLELQKIKHDILTEGYRSAEANITSFKEGKLQLRPGCNAEESLEEILNGLLGKLRESAGQEAMQALPWSNAPRIMAECGSKGSPLNISQMIACVGQQAVGGLRIQNGFVNRTLPHFTEHCLDADAKGFVANSFYTGLTATEFFFHTMGGREGLVDTAVKTAETGYMARRLMKALEDLSLQYDNTVQNSEKTIVQFTYGDDSLNPEAMEASDTPVEFDRMRVNVCLHNPDKESAMLTPTEIMKQVKRTMASKYWAKITPKFNDDQKIKGKKIKSKIFEDIEGYFENIGKKIEEIEKAFPTKGKRSTAKENKERSEALDQLMTNSCRLTKDQLDDFLSRILLKYRKASVQPGEAVGATGAQSISEPGTQMTLKTFHFAGVSSMNVTLGVPRLKEIINASKLISTPIITAFLNAGGKTEVGARVVKAAIEKTTLGEISEYIEEVYAPNQTYLAVKLNMTTIKDLKLEITPHIVRERILRGVTGQTRPAILRLLKDKDVQTKGADHIRVSIPEAKKKKGKPDGTIEDEDENHIYFAMQQLKAALPKVIVCGIHTINRAVINETEENWDEKLQRNEDKYHLLVEGYGLLDVMGSVGIDGSRTESNHVIEIESTLGVEAARGKISKEINYIMSAYGIGIDPRHLLLLADVMTFKGEVLGITRFGVSKMRESVLMLASFEKTTDHLFDAAVHGRVDEIVGVSECIIMGIPIPLGTGLFKLLKSAQVKEDYDKKKKGGRSTRPRTSSVGTKLESEVTLGEPIMNVLSRNCNDVYESSQKKPFFTVAEEKIAARQ